jgi:predicted alpha/beta superfamily hydrolase
MKSSISGLGELSKASFDKLFNKTPKEKRKIYGYVTLIGTDGNVLFDIMTSFAQEYFVDRW